MRPTSTAESQPAHSLDSTLYRLLSSQQGRWLSPDPVRGRPADPQSWNRFRAMEIAVSALSEAPCRKHFGGFVGGLELWEALTSFYSGADGWGTIQWQNNMNLIGWTSTPIGTYQDPETGRYAIVNIDLHQWLFGATSDEERARTLIHELGHVYNDHIGGGGSDFLDDLSGTPEESAKTQANNRKLELECIPEKK